MQSSTSETTPKSTIQLYSETERLVAFGIVKDFKPIGSSTDNGRQEPQMNISEIPLGGVVRIAWSGEPVTVTYKCPSWVTVKPFSPELSPDANGNYSRRDISTGVEVVAYESEAVVTKEAKTKTRTIHDLTLDVVRLRWERSLNAESRDTITQAGKHYGLLDDEGRPTSKYWALMSDEAEQLARELTGNHKLCVCGCGKRAKLGVFAQKRCRFVSRSKKVRDRQNDAPGLAKSLNNFDTFSA